MPKYFLPGFVLPFLVLTVLALTVQAQDITLPAPQTTGGKPMFDAMKQRQSTRELAGTPIDRQTLSDLLWAAWGFNREDKRVIPTALNKQELDVFVFLPEGVYRYDPKANKLVSIAKGDHRKAAGRQDYVHAAPVNFLYVADRSKAASETVSYVSCGAAAQNVYLACASKNIGCTVRTSIDAEELKKLLKLSPSQDALVGQTIGNKK